MSFLIFVGCSLTGLASLASATAPAITPGVHIFEAHLQDSPCGNNAFCGTGRLTGFGRVKTRTVFQIVGTAAAAGCLAMLGTRTLTLRSEPKSTLRLAVKGALCGSRGWGTFKVSSGRGAFARATGSGVILGTLSATRLEHLHYSGVLTLARK